MVKALDLLARCFHSCNEPARRLQADIESGKVRLVVVHEPEEPEGGEVSDV